VTVIRDGKTVETLSLHAGEVTQERIIRGMVGRDLESFYPDRVSSPGEEVLRVEDWTVWHPTQDRTVVEGANFTVRAGEVVGIAGLMGAGRTELARALVGADPVDGGTVHVNGEQVVVRSPADAARHGMGHLSEDRKRSGLLLERDVVTNLLLPSLAAHTNRLGVVRDRLAGRTASAMVNRLRIKTPSLAQPVKNLSGGNQQKVVIGKWLVKDCDILIFDEPTRGVDVGAKEEIYELLDDLVAQGKAIIMISSELEEVLRMSHRVVVMCAGRITGVLDGAEADQQVVMEHATRFSA
jgi:putative multiple sugar transport system ATP-binding protein